MVHFVTQIRPSRFLRSPISWDLGRGTWDLGRGTWDFFVKIVEEFFANNRARSNLIRFSKIQALGPIGSRTRNPANAFDSSDKNLGWIQTRPAIDRIRIRLVLRQKNRKFSIFFRANFLQCPKKVSGSFAKVSKRISVTRPPTFMVKRGAGFLDSFRFDSKSIEIDSMFEPNSKYSKDFFQFSFVIQRLMNFLMKAGIIRKRKWDISYAQDHNIYIIFTYHMLKIISEYISHIKCSEQNEKAKKCRKNTIDTSGCVYLHLLALPILPPLPSLPPFW